MPAICDDSTVTGRFSAPLTPQTNQSAQSDLQIGESIHHQGDDPRIGVASAAVSWV